MGSGLVREVDALNASVAATEAKIAAIAAVAAPSGGGYHGCSRWGGDRQHHIGRVVRIATMDDIPAIVGMMRDFHSAESPPWPLSEVAAADIAAAVVRTGLPPFRHPE